MGDEESKMERNVDQDVHMIIDPDSTPPIITATRENPREDRHSRSFSDFSSSSSSSSEDSDSSDDSDASNGITCKKDHMLVVINEVNSHSTKRENDEEPHSTVAVKKRCTIVDDAKLERIKQLQANDAVIAARRLEVIKMKLHNEILKRDKIKLSITTEKEMGKAVKHTMRPKRHHDIAGRVQVAGDSTTDEDDLRDQEVKDIITKHKYNSRRTREETPQEQRGCMSVVNHAHIKKVQEKRSLIATRRLGLQRQPEIKRNEPPRKIDHDKLLKITIDQILGKKNKY